jgi:hypothetical protein
MLSLLLLVIILVLFTTFAYSTIYASANDWEKVVGSGLAPVHNWGSSVGGRKYAFGDSSDKYILYIEVSKFSHNTINNGRIVRTSEKHVYSEMTSYSDEFNGLMLNHQQRVVFNGFSYQLETMMNGQVVKHKQITVITVSSTYQAWYQHDSQRDNTLMSIACDVHTCLQDCRCGNSISSYNCKRCLMDHRYY